MAPSYDTKQKKSCSAESKTCLCRTHFDRSLVAFAGDREGDSERERERETEREKEREKEKPLRHFLPPPFSLNIASQREK